ncbi:hypothetical protein CY34DRAFT_812758 [Suillus luteus UH-Slu-Lm8-n1]|uniref:Uncharacterized protein n=1 Tax=Suillus luteus UH-Slu-Lm8-n1 TaxID=930992 RepID=A0A0D0ARU1_9AGAM|nr:hypothetical protein CY34DRAFT_812758 [Suillus luteus UH-Slu-Lm8-n1]
MNHRRFTQAYHLPINFDNALLEIKAAPRQGHRCFVSFLEAITLRIAEFNHSAVWSVFQSLALVLHPQH